MAPKLKASFCSRNYSVMKSVTFWVFADIIAIHVSVFLIIIIITEKVEKNLSKKLVSVIG